MNEVTKIHLGRQAFTIATDAHKELHAYLDAIKAQVHDVDVVEEVELRMAELLAERGVAGDKVILAGDVDYLKSQLGSPKDFNEDNESTTEKEPVETKRLFRDAEGGMLAGVASGLAKYFGIDVLLVRILFIIGIFTGGWSILLYVALWLLVPEAKTSSERLQMAGQPVTVNSLKEVVARADVAGAAHRANQTLSGPINSIFRVVLKLIGLSLIIIGLSFLFALIALEGYVLVHSGNFFGQDIFPVGFREHLLLHLGVAVSALLSVLIVIFGVSIFKQKWPVKLWVTGTLVGLTLIGLASTMALGADVAPQIRDRYNAHFHTSVRSVQPFTTVKAIGDNVRVQYQLGSAYSVNLHYYDHPELSVIKTSVTNGVLLVDSSQFNWQRHCPSFCIPDNYALIITVTSPVPIDIPDSADVPTIPIMPTP